MSVSRILIVGSGAGGLFLARELGLRGCDVTVAHEQPLAQYASTRNQGWLQGGALYAGINQPRVARECKVAAEWLTRFAPAAVDHQRRAFYLFERLDDAESFAARNAGAGIEFRDVRRLSRVAELSSIVQGSLYDYAVEAYDRPFNSSAVLRVVRDEVIAAGCSFVHVQQMSSCLRRASNSWALIGHPTTFDIVVIAAGALIPELVSNLGFQIPFDPMWITVLSVSGFPLDCMLLSPQPYRPNIVPFAEALGDGFTLTLSKMDQLGSPNPNHVTSASSAVWAEFARTLPSLATQASSGTHISPHYCTKLARRGNSEDRGFTIEPITSTNDLWIFYPGKFTTAPLAARHCARAVLGEPPGAVPVMNQPYHP